MSSITGRPCLSPSSTSSATLTLSVKPTTRKLLVCTFSSAAVFSFIASS